MSKPEFYNKDKFLAEIRKAYAKLKVKVLAGQFYTDDNSACCPLSALFCYHNDKKVEDVFSSLVMNFAAKHYNVSQESLAKFMDGFDGRKPIVWHKFDEEAYKLGQYCREQLKPEVEILEACLTNE